MYSDMYCFCHIDLDLQITYDVYVSHKHVLTSKQEEENNYVQMIHGMMKNLYSGDNQ